jgi:hypothetical protein
MQDLRVDAPGPATEQCPADLRVNYICIPARHLYFILVLVSDLRRPVGSVYLFI